MSPVGQPVNQKEKPYRPAGLASGPLVQSGRPLTHELILLNQDAARVKPSEGGSARRSAVETGS